MNRLINWIEIPVSDMARAVKFYEGVLGAKPQEMSMGDVHYALFLTEDRFNSGALAQGEGYVPSASGVTIYLDGGSDLDLILSKVKAKGGKVVMPKTNLGEQAGWVGMFIDSEGNRIGLQHM